MGLRRRGASLRPAQKAFVDAIRGKIGARLKAVLITDVAITGKGNAASNFLYQSLREWEAGSKITDSAFEKMMDRLEAAGRIDKEDRRQLRTMADAANQERPRIRHAELPLQALKSGKFLERLEQNSIALRDLRDPGGVIMALNAVTAEMRSSNNIRKAMGWSWHFLNFYSERGKDHLGVGEHFRLEAAAYAAWFMSWMALQIESVKGVEIAWAALERLDREHTSPSIKTALHTISSYHARITHPSDQYPDVNFARRAFASAKAGGGQFPADLGDPLILYNAANELRLRRHPMNRASDLFDGRSLEEQLILSADEAIARGRSQEAIRIRGSLVRGLIYDGRSDDAEEAAQPIFVAGAQTGSWMLSSRANALHSEGLLLCARGDPVGFESLAEAAKIYGNLGAEKRREDVLIDKAKYKQGALLRARPVW